MTTLPHYQITNSGGWYAIFHPNHSEACHRIAQLYGKNNLGDIPYDWPEGTVTLFVCCPVFRTRQGLLDFLSFLQSKRISEPEINIF